VGPQWLLTELWETLGLADLIRRALRSSRRGFDVEAAVRLMVFNRLCDPESKLGLLRWLEGVVVPGIDMAAITHQHLLRAMDALMDKRQTIHKGLSKQLLPLIDRELSVVFYDLTTIRIHGETEVEGDLRRYGHSKELKGPARQCVLGLVQTADGLPLDFDVFEGNVAEVKTLPPMLERCVKRYPIKRVIVVADPGAVESGQCGRGGKAGDRRRAHAGVHPRRSGGALWGLCTAHRRADLRRGQGQCPRG